ncbi:tachykinin-4 [Electrophorus electricus]|uniref:tachykinin-4 n=1 Tax=Electrophorus electricus TaxID=8005 RepID=UPI0015CFA280|nr:tachykinin-4 [Electrophorus electricus]
MEILKISVLAVALYTQVYSDASSLGEDRDILSVENWQDDPAEIDLTLRFADLMKRSKSQQFHGLMGRNSEISHPLRLGRKRNKGEMFVGLMGRRSSSGDFEEELDKPQLY